MWRLIGRAWEPSDLGVDQRLTVLIATVDTTKQSETRTIRKRGPFHSDVRSLCAFIIAVHLLWYW